ncbi:MAG: carbohydrate ABC transporter substrate-binding protein [Peptoniphilaceae bacterium]|nr:carbohydrate ABC transporter substrate-binding protein [Peptoniphilaceae bacterium]
MKTKKIVGLLLACALTLGACGSSKAPAKSSEAPKASVEQSSTAKSGGATIKVAAIETAYGQEGWKAVVKAYEEATGNKVELVMDKKLEDVIGPQMKAGDYPDVIHLATGRDAALTETFIKDKNIEEITDVLDMTIPGETGKVKDKLIGGITDSTATKPYGDGKLYLAPMFYSPCGLYYNAGLFEQKGWEVPKTWDEMWALGDKAKAEGISLFTYPTTGYFDAFFYALLDTVGGPEFYNKATSFEKGIWETEEAKKAFDIIAKLATYTDPTTPAQANDQDFTKNQQLILDNKALFMPNGSWVAGEMKDAPRADGFKWGMMPIPAVKDGGDRYSFTWLEQSWIPAGAKNKDAAKQFVAFLYSDKAVELFAKNGAYQPTSTVTNFMTDEAKAMNGVYENGAKATLGGFPVFDLEGKNARTIFFDPVNSLVAGTLTEDEYVKSINEVNDQIREAVTK